MKGLLKPANIVWLFLPFLLYLVWRDVPFDQVFEMVNRLNPWQVLVFILMNALLVLLFNVRWWLILVILGHRVTYLRLSAYRLASFAVSFLTPGPQFGGEPVQVYALTRRHGVPSPAAFASVVLDKMIELLANFTFLAVGSFIILESGLAAGLNFNLAALVGLALLLLPAGYLGALVVGWHPFDRLLDLLDRLGLRQVKLDALRKATVEAEGITAGFCRGQPLAFAGIFLVSMAVWLLMMVEYRLAFSFIGLELSIVQVIFALVAARLALLLPFPGGLGSLEASQVLAVQALGFNPAYGVGIMLLARGRDFVIAALGVISMLAVTRSNKHSKLGRSTESAQDYLRRLG